MNIEERLQAVVSQSETDSSKWHTIVHGDDTTTVPTENGNVPSVAKQMKDVHDEVVNGVIDYLTECQNARDVTLQTKTETIAIKNETNTIKNDTASIKSETESLKNQSQAIFNNIAAATNSSVLTIQNEGTTQVTNVQNAVAEQVAEATSQANRAEAATSSKANLDFSNIAPSASAKASIIAWIAPDWSRRQVLALNADVTISQYGWVLMRNVVYNSSLSGYINGNLVFRQYGNYGHWEEYNSLMVLVCPGDIVRLSGGGELAFMPCKGV